MKHYPKITFNSSELILLNIRFLVFLLKKTSHHFHPNSAVNCQNNYVTNGKWSADLSNNKFATEEYFQKTFLCKWKVWKVNSRSINSNTRVPQGLIIKFLMKNLKKWAHKKNQWFAAQRRINICADMTAYMHLDLTRGLLPLVHMSSGLPGMINFIFSYIYIWK